MNVQALDTALKAACPIVTGVSIGDPADRTTWSASYASPPTAAQQSAVQQLIAGWSDPAPVSTITGNQWAFALSDLSLASAWRTGVARSKDSDQVRVGLIARDTPLLASDPLLIRVAGNAGTDSGGNPLVSVPAVFAHAQGMPL